MTCIFRSFTLVSCLCLSLMLHAQKFDRTFIDQQLGIARLKYKFAAEHLDRSKGYPCVGKEHGEWEQKKSTWWVSAYFSGILWNLWADKPSNDFKKWAQYWMEGLETNIDIPRHPSVGVNMGFLLFDSYGKAYRYTKNATYKPFVLRAADSLTSLYSPITKTILTWTWGGKGDGDRWDFPVVIDNMMNLELLFWASKNGGNVSNYNAAYQHGLSTVKNHQRSDGSSFHLVDYNSQTGEIRKKITFQGYSDTSCWSRGQAWSMYGYTVCFRESGDSVFLNAAIKASNYFLEHLDQDGVPHWDFIVRNTDDHQKDASAGACAASALLELQKFVQDPELKKKYISTAKSMLLALSKAPYFEPTMQKSALLMHSVGAKHIAGKPVKQGSGEVDTSLIYADYYYIEALMRYKNWILRP